MKLVRLSLVSGGGSRLKVGRAETKLNEGETRKLLSLLPTLTLIRCRAPASVYELAHELRADISNVRKAVKILADLGLVEFSEQRVKNRRRLAPRVPFENIAISFTKTTRQRPLRRELMRRHLAP